MMFSDNLDDINDAICVLASMYEDLADTHDGMEMMLGTMNKKTGKHIRIMISYDKD